jgi:hypothetical protein
MATPITPETPVGYIVAEDVYISYSEYYGDGTIYGRVDLLTSDGNPVKGGGKSKADLINANVRLSDIVLGSISGDLVVVPNELSPLAEETPVSQPVEGEAPVSQPVEGEAPVSPPVEGEAPVSPPVEGEAPVSPPVEGEAPVSPPVEAEVPVSPPVDTVKPSTNESESDNRYTVSFSLLGFDITREFTTKIDIAARKIYLS